jgi:hypothetical protein
MNPRRDAPIVLAPLVAFGGLATGNRWLVLFGAALAWVALGIGSRRTAHRKPFYAGVIATAVAGGVDYVLSGGAFFVHLRSEFPCVRVSVGIEAVRGVLMTTSLLIFATVRMRVGFVLSSFVSGASAFVFGFVFERFGASGLLWVWNHLTVPNADFGGVPVFVPVAWGFAFLFSGYFLAEPKRETMPGFSILSSGLRCGTGYGASFMLCWAMFLRYFGRATGF